MSDFEALKALVELIMKLGMSVWKAVESGRTDVTVDEILKGVGYDMDHMRELHEAAQRYYGDKAAVTTAARLLPGARLPRHTVMPPVDPS